MLDKGERPLLWRVQSHPSCRCSPGAQPKAGEGRRPASRCPRYSKGRSYCPCRPAPRFLWSFHKLRLEGANVFPAAAFDSLRGFHLPAGDGIRAGLWHQRPQWWAAKPRAGPAPPSRYGLRNMSFAALGESESAADVEADVRVLFASSPAWLPFCLVSGLKRAHVPPRSLFAGFTPGSSHQLCRHSHGAAGQGSGAAAKQAAGAGLVPSGAGQAARLRGGQLSRIRSSPLCKPLAGTSDKNLR